MDDCFIMFYNLRGNKKLAVKLNGQISWGDLSPKMNTFINKVCDDNKYTFSFHKISLHGEFSNIPIIDSKLIEVV